MAITEFDRMLLKLAEISEKDFESQSVEEQEKSLRKGMNKYIQSRKNKRNPEYIENAKKELPKIKEMFIKKTLVYAKAVGANIGIGVYQVVGYFGDKKKILIVNPETTAEEPKIYKIDESSIILTVED